MRRLTNALVAAAVVLGATIAVTSSPAHGQADATTVVAVDVVLAPSASCRFGDINITYQAQGAQRQRMLFSAADGAVLDEFETQAFEPDHADVEHMLTEADAVPAVGTVLGVYAYVGTTPPEAAATAEFFVLYRCDSRSSSEGGVNQVLDTCMGAYGTCPQTAAQALQPPPSVPPTEVATTVVATQPATAVTATPTFTG